VTAIGFYDAAERYGGMARTALAFYLSTGNPAELLAAYLYARHAFSYAARYQNRQEGKP
jgi:hypothetical protein